MSTWLMAAYLNGLNAEEASALTEVMLNSGYRFDFSHMKEKKVDKHSTGGVGDKTSMILAPIVAATGVKVPMIAGRGLGHTGGTLDKLEAISGFDTRISKEEFSTNLEKIGYSIMGQTDEICPADKRIYSLRDVTATIESIPLICASIMSKKLAEGIDGLVLDVKVGTGAFMKTSEMATELASQLRAIGIDHGCDVRAIITDMNQPLGRHCGNANEIYECEQILKNTEESKTDYADCRELSLELSAHMISIGKSIPMEEARNLAEEQLENGKAWEKFIEMVQMQKGNYDIQSPVYDKDVVATKDGYLSSFDTENIGIAGIQLGAGRKVVSDVIDPLAGIYVHKKIGDKINKGDKIFSIFAKDKSKYNEAEDILQSSFAIEESAPKIPSLIKKVLM
jgi:pyrimidine-nucleoside phosphorylase